MISRDSRIEISCFIKATIPESYGNFECMIYHGNLTTDGNVTKYGEEDRVDLLKWDQSELTLPEHIVGFSFQTIEKNNDGSEIKKRLLYVLSEEPTTVEKAKEKMGKDSARFKPILENVCEKGTDAFVKTDYCEYEPVYISNLMILPKELINKALNWFAEEIHEKIHRGEDTTEIINHDHNKKLELARN